MFPMAQAAPFARNVACRGVLVIYFSDFKIITFCYVFLRCIMISVSSRGSDKPVCHGGAKVHDYKRVLLRPVTLCCGQLRFDQGVTRFFRSVKVSYGQNVDTIQYKELFSFCIRISPLK